MTLWAVFLLGGWNGGRAVAISLNRGALAAFDTMPDPRLRLGMALIWTVLFLGAALALWQKRPFIRRAVPILFTIYTLYELGLLAFYAQAPPTRHSWPINALFYLTLILFSAWGLNRTAVKNYFEVE
ncbi:MAG: hypothetical protein GY803_06730 [Chloroflexi bacterium]|nr:hypothetical protein [Chloroflexota bacterium]